MDRFIELTDDVDGVQLNQLPPFTTLLVWTWNSLYQVIIIDGTTVYVQGGSYFPDPTRARVNGSTMGGSLLKLAWIGIGLLMEFEVAGTRILTSPVLAITTQLAGVSLIH